MTKKSKKAKSEKKKKTKKSSKSKRRVSKSLTESLIGDSIESFQVPSNPTISKTDAEIPGSMKLGGVDLKPSKDRSYERKSWW